MFFILSKLFWLVAMPSNLILLLGGAGVALLFTRGRRRLGRGLCAAAVVLLGLLGATPFGEALLRPLEGRFPRPTAPATAPNVIVVLGGGIEVERSVARGVVSLNESGGRLTEALALARRFPEARVVYSGCRGELFASGPCEADLAGRFFAETGLDPERLMLERGSRNTHENAVLTRDLIKPAPGESWLLVTSAFHMPRSVGIFRQAGLPVTPWPAAYLTGPAQWGDVAAGLRRTDIAVREWIGLLAYRATGRTDALYPGP